MVEEIRIVSKGNVEKVVAYHSSEDDKKKKDKSREHKDSFAGEDGQKLDEGAIVNKKSKKKRIDSEAEDDEKKSKKNNEVTSDDVEKKSKKKSKETRVESEADDDGKKKKKKKKEKNKEKRVDSEIEDDGVKKSKKKSKEIRVDVEVDDDGKKKKSVDSEIEDDGGKKSKKKTKGISVDDDVKDKKSKKESGGGDDDDEIGNSESSKVYEDSEGNRIDEKKTRKRKRDDSNLGAEENIENSSKEMQRKIKKKKSNVGSEVEEKSLISAKDAKKKSKKKKPSENSEAKKKSKKKQKSDTDVTTPSSKSTKRVKFSDKVEVFHTEDAEREEEVVELVRGKRYSKEEDELIKQAVLEYVDNHALGDEGVMMVMECQSHPQTRGCWKEIASALPWRPLGSVYLRAHNIFESGSKGVWTKEDFELIKEYQKKHGNNWSALAEAMGKNRYHVKDAWRRTRLDIAKGHWSKEEYQTLFDLVNRDLRMKANQEKHSKHGMLRDNIPWMAISDELSTRDHTTCCLKWYKQLTSPMVTKGIWANVDDYKLLEELLNLDAACIDDVDWDNLLENRDGEACRKRWNQMARHIGSPGAKTFAEQVEILSQRYCPDIAEDREDFDNRPYDPED